MEALLFLTLVVSFVFGYSFLGKNQSFFIKTILGFSGMLLTPMVIGSLPVLWKEILANFQEEYK